MKGRTWQARPARPARPIRVLVVGIGNLLREDDGVAWRVVQALNDERLESVVCRNHVQLTPELAEEFSRAEHLILVDAAINVPVGEWRTVTIQAEGHHKALTHQPEIGQLLELTGALYGRAPKTQVVSVGGERFGYGEALSASVTEALPAVLDEVRSLALRLAASPSASGSAR